MKILVTGANGFVGKNLIATLEQYEEYTVLPITRAHSSNDLKAAIDEADFIFHLAGANRPKTEAGYTEDNVNFTESIVQHLIYSNKSTPIVLSSSIQATNGSPYGNSKSEAENLIFAYGEKMSAEVYVYRLPNLFGKWSKPNYNSVIATFCHHLSRNQEIVVNDPTVELTFVYIDDLISEFLNALQLHPTKNNQFCKVEPEYQVRLGSIVQLLQSFKSSRENRELPNFADAFTKKLYSTYLSFLPTNDFKYPLLTHSDHRGSFTEFTRSLSGGQVSINVSKAGITKGEHWHHTKNEKFLVVTGQGVIRFRDYYSDEIIEYEVSGETLEVVDIPPGYTHSIVNTGDVDMVTVMWVNEMFNPTHPDTFSLEV